MVVVKVGGSLYDWPGLGPALRAFVAALAPARVLLVPGGGDFADAVRAVHRVHGLSEERAHWLALVSLKAAGEFLSALVPAAAVLDAHAFCRDAAPDLPHSWRVTSDSVAARAAIGYGADRLVLLKSVDIPPGTPWPDAAARGWVDDYFPTLAVAFAGQVEAVNLRAWGGRSA